MTKTKRCSHCGAVHPATPAFFWRDATTSDGLYSICKACTRQRDAQRDAVRNGTPDRRLVQRVTSANFRARTAGVPGVLTASAARQIIEASGGHCFWCGAEVGTDYHFDHIQPMGRGGANTPDNVCVSCPTCNNRKAENAPAVFVSRLAARGIQHELASAFGITAIAVPLFDDLAFDDLEDEPTDSDSAA